MEQIDAAAAAGDPRIDEVRVHQMHAIHDRPYLAGAYGTRLKHISYFLSHVTRPYFADGSIGLVPAHFSEVYALMRMRTDDPLVDRCCVAARPSRLLLARRVGRLHLELHRPRPDLPRGHRPHAAHVRTQPDPRVAGGRLVPQRPTARRGAARHPRRHRPSHRRTRRRADPQRRHDPDRHRRDPQRDHGIADRPQGSRHPHRAGLRRRGRPDGVGRGQRGPQAAEPHEGGGHVRARHRAAAPVPPREHRDRTARRALRERSAHHRQRTQLRVDQRHAHRRLPRAVRVRDDRRPVLLVVGWPERLRTRRVVLGGRPGVRGPALDDLAVATHASCRNSRQATW